MRVLGEESSIFFSNMDSSFAKGAGVSMWLALVGTLFGCHHWFSGRYRADDPG